MGLKIEHIESGFFDLDQIIFSILINIALKSKSSPPLYFCFFVKLFIWGYDLDINFNNRNNY